MHTSEDSFQTDDSGVKKMYVARLKEKVLERTYREKRDIDRLQATLDKNKPSNK